MGAMKIWHAGALWPSRVNGVNATVWLLAQAQAKLGHRVSLLMDEPADDEARLLAERSGLTLLDWNNPKWSWNRAELQTHLSDPELRPQLVHMHSVFIPRQATLAAELSSRSIPYLVTPHGGLSKVILSRGRLKKWIYGVLVERGRCRNANRLTVAPGEAGDLEAYLGADHPPMRVMPIPIDAEKLGTQRWCGDVGARRLVFLGRFDVLVKGLDTLIDVAKLLPEFSFDLYGHSSPRCLRQIAKLKENAGPNVHFHGPVFGLDKAKALCQASAYIQLSRSESFGIAVAEAMYLGVPCIIADSMNLADEFHRYGLGMTLPRDPMKIASSLRDVFAAPQQLYDFAGRASRYANAYYEPHAAASKYLSLYQQVLVKPRAILGEDEIVESIDELVEPTHAG